ncbi:hypothetical protein AB9F39_37705, partial [Rhizobium leguminosarum]
AQSKTLTISWWGYNGEKMNANIITPFKKICGFEILFETGNNADRLNNLKLRERFSEPDLKAVPGFGEAHKHIESSHLTPEWE